MTKDNLIKHIDLSDFKTFNEIQEEAFINYGVAINDREWREMVEQYNRNHFIKNGGRGIYIAGTSKGYIRTYRKEFIQENMNRKIRTAINVLKQCREVEHALGNRENQRLFELIGQYESDRA